MARTEEYQLNVGPVHPSTHGVLRFLLTMEGETIKDVEMIIGQLHRGIEKIAESRSYLQFIPYTDRLDYISGMTNNYGFTKAVEDLAGITVPKKAEYLRVFVMELNRIVNHLVCIGSLLLDLGAATMIIYGFRERHKILELFESLSGARMTFNYIRPGGVRGDIPEGFIDKAKAFLRDMPKRLDDYAQLINENEIVLMRMKGIGMLSPEDAINYGVTGPMLRGSGVSYDIRKDDPYSVYEELDFKACTRPECDTYARYIVRMDEMYESLYIAEQALDRIEHLGGPVKAHFPRIFTPPEGEVYSRIEAPKGELGFYIVSDGSTRPYRVKIRSPPFCSLQALPQMVEGLKIPDLVATFGIVDIALGDVDR
ncbi:NADH-quinone oxidoreductase subunit D [Candidatus Methanoperedenaceae archaeon GB50]|nr:NADH-quinone oxidoreductase subunit D [Candidatus Methanoperedenaceae archaeon GB37]CAD7768524.1 NADH-quinone oxidoreductase subunit D [Candidatus Methanoperedenaceae archaeon GB50]CAD7773955.1 MAG: NADH-quinone oxidoreductase subunit C/D [Candidatus Methanoperedenaceae archaeon GB50]